MLTNAGEVLGNARVELEPSPPLPQRSQRYAHIVNPPYDLCGFTKTLYMSSPYIMDLW